MVVLNAHVKTGHLPKDQKLRKNYQEGSAAGSGDDTEPTHGTRALKNPARADYVSGNMVFYLVVRPSKDMCKAAKGDWMKRTSLAALIILSFFALLFFGVGCGKKTVVAVKANKYVLALSKTVGKDVAFYTSKENPLKTIEGLKQNEIACWGPELADKIQAFYIAAGTQRAYGNAVQAISADDRVFGMANSPRLYLTWTANERRLKGAVRVKFYE